MGDNYKLKIVRPKKAERSEAAKRSGEEAQKALLSPVTKMLAKREERRDPPTPPFSQGTKAALQTHCG